MNKTIALVCVCALVGGCAAAKAPASDPAMCNAKPTNYDMWVAADGKVMVSWTVSCPNDMV